MHAILYIGSIIEWDHNGLPSWSPHPQQGSAYSHYSPNTLLNAAGFIVYSIERVCMCANMDAMGKLYIMLASKFIGFSG